MKVIKPGRQQKGWAKEYTCTGEGNGGGGCGATLLVESVDVYHTYWSFCGRDQETLTTFTCGACGVETDIEGCPLLELPTKEEWEKSRLASVDGKRGEGR